MCRGLSGQSGARGHREAGVGRQLSGLRVNVYVELGCYLAVEYKWLRLFSNYHHLFISSKD